MMEGTTVVLASEYVRVVAEGGDVAASRFHKCNCPVDFIHCLIDPRAPRPAFHVPINSGALVLA